MAAVKAHPVVGILGGMGPEASLELTRRVIAGTPAGDDGDHIHMILDSNPKVPSRMAALIDGNGEDPTPELVRMAQGLEAAGATMLAIACNTAHAYADAIAGSVAIPLLDMVKLSAAHLAGLSLPRRRVGMLASTAVRTLGLYEAALAPHGIALAWPARQPDLMAVIQAVKRGDTSRDTREAFATVAADLAADGVDALLVACTELSILAPGLDANAVVVDALDVLVAEIIARAGGPQVVETRIMPAEPSHLAGIEACARAAYRKYVARMGREPAPMVADFAQSIAAGQVRVAVDDRGLSGFVVSYRRGDHLHVENIAVLPDRQGYGTGTALLRHVEDAARQSGLAAIELYTNEKMTENFAYYTRRGYLEIDRREEDGFRRVFYRKTL